MKKLLLGILILGAVACNDDSTKTTETKDTTTVVSKDTNLVIKEVKTIIDTIK